MQPVVNMVRLVKTTNKIQQYCFTWSATLQVLTHDSEAYDQLWSQGTVPVLLIMIEWVFITAVDNEN